MPTYIKLFNLFNLREVNDRWNIWNHGMKCFVAEELFAQLEKLGGPEGNMGPMMSMMMQVRITVCLAFF